MVASHLETCAVGRNMDAGPDGCAQRAHAVDALDHFVPCHPEGRHDPATGYLLERFCRICTMQATGSVFISSRLDVIFDNTQWSVCLMRRETVRTTRLQP